jgi:hypothetical protein
MASDRDLWALTIRVERDHGAGAPRYIAERIGEAAVADNRAGIDLWKAVAARFDQLRPQRSLSPLG